MKIETDITANILLVDDEENILLSLKRSLRSSKLNIITATSAKKGLEILQEEQIDLIISDMRMPEMDGAEFLELVNKDQPKIMKILLTGYSDMETTVDAINKGGIFKYISKPWEDSDLKSTVRNALKFKKMEEQRDILLNITQRQTEELTELNKSLEKKVENRTKNLTYALEKVEKLNTELKDNLVDVIKIFSGIIDQREGKIADHSKRVADTCRKIGVSIGLEGDQLQNLVLASLLHDFGKIVLPDSLMNTPYAELTRDQRVEFKKHPQIAQTMLMGLEFLNAIGDIIGSHHEYHDGTGFPNGLRGDKIPLEARILVVVNDYDSLISGTIASYRYSEQEAIEYVKNNSGKKYDPEVVKHFLALNAGVNSDNSKTTQKTSSEETAVRSFELKPDMVLLRDLKTSAGIMLVQRGKKLEESMIKKILSYEKLSGEKLYAHVSEI